MIFLKTKSGNYYGDSNNSELKKERKTTNSDNSLTADFKRKKMETKNGTQSVK